MSKCVLPTSQKPTRKQSTETHTEKSTEKFTEKSTGKSTKSTMILLKPPFESATMMSTGWSPKRTSEDDYLAKQRLRVNATTSCKIYSIEHAEALHRAQTALARLNLVSITILQKLMC